MILTQKHMKNHLFIEIIVPGMIDIKFIVLSYNNFKGKLSGLQYFHDCKL